MNFTRQELIEKVKNKDVKFFTKLYYEGDRENIVYDENNGDGREWHIAFHFPEANLNILMEGYYSSHDSSEFDTISLAIPYEFKETRYKALTQEEIRDLNIDIVIK